MAVLHAAVVLYVRLICTHWLLVVGGGTVKRFLVACIGAVPIAEFLLMRSL